jgi:hypothetical protein
VKTGQKNPVPFQLFTRLFWYYSEKNGMGRKRE